MKDVNFLPFVGKNYEQGLNSKKILVLGESHYCSEDQICHDLTTKVLNKYFHKPNGYERWMNTFKKFERALSGINTTDNDSIEIWNKVAFYNYLQCAIGDTRLPGTEDDYKNAELPFFTTLNQLNPDYLIVWGKRLYNNLPSKGWQNTQILTIDNYDIITGEYLLDSGKVVKVLVTIHPSAAFTWTYWHEVFERWWK